MAPKTKMEDTAAQAKRFRKAARELECEDSEDRFKAALRTVGKAKPAEQRKGKRDDDQH